MAVFRIGVVGGCLKAGKDPRAIVAAAQQVGADGLQVQARPPAGVSLDDYVKAWRDALGGGTKVKAFSTVTGFAQEDYSSIAAIHRTGGLVPDDVAEANVRIVLDGVAFARALGVDLITFHAGFIPESPDDPVFGRLLDRLGCCADAAAADGVRIGLESGQESAAALVQFLKALGRDNVGCNFDPANMILYGRQDPLEAAPVLAPHIMQVHAKDGVWSDAPGVQWGQEVRLGEGDVQFARLVSRLRVLGYGGDLVIEREAGAQPLNDIGDGVRFLRSLQ
ncbi:MAG: hypothetical protein BIFFINMI_02477 [Phycisphaerae bacterium]|nr:hypothetical protein [Phycisphaerae bacterium]